METPGGSRSSGRHVADFLPPEPEPGGKRRFLSPVRGSIMPSISPEQLVQRVSDAGLLDARQIESLWAEMGTREVTLEALVGVLLRKELLTNYQLDRLLKGEKGGYFYGEYKVLYLVGTGTFARVYRAVNSRTGR